jgi:hypothetical protein
MFDCANPPSTEAAATKSERHPAWNVAAECLDVTSDLVFSGGRDGLWAAWSGIKSAGDAAVEAATSTVETSGAAIDVAAGLTSGVCHAAVAAVETAGTVVDVAGSAAEATAHAAGAVVEIVSGLAP